MKEQIEKLEVQLQELKKVYEIEQRIRYELSEHKHFDKGQIVTNGKKIGIVEWTSNQSCDCAYEKGYMGLQLITENRGFLCFAKRDEWEVVDDNYYLQTHKIEIELTGLEIEEIKYSLGGRNINPNKSKSKILDYFNTIH